MSGLQDAQWVSDLIRRVEAAEGETASATARLAAVLAELRQAEMWEYDVEARCIQEGDEIVFRNRTEVVVLAERCGSERVGDCWYIESASGWFAHRAGDYTFTVRRPRVASTEVKAS